MRYYARIIKAIEDIRASYWFLPTVLVCVAVALSQTMLWLDSISADLPFQLPQSLRDTRLEGARSLMGVIATSVFGVAGVMFSMTILAVSYASGNFGPRLIGNFMRDRGNQWSLGILIATYVYALMILRSIREASGEQSDMDVSTFVPHFAINFALILTIGAVLTVIFFVHHIPETINVSNITAGLGARLSASLRKLIDLEEDTDAPKVEWPSDWPKTELTASSAGYVQTIDTSRLKELANTHDLYIRLNAQTGEFVTEFTPAIEVYAKSAPEDEQCTDIVECLAIGTSKTEHQNVLFIVDQLVEMIARALSPGVNDPFTAMNCLNWLHVGIDTALEYEQGLQPLPADRVDIGRLTQKLLIERAIVVPLPYIVTDKICSDHLATILKQIKTDKLEVEVRDLLRDVQAHIEQASTKEIQQ